MTKIRFFAKLVLASVLTYGVTSCDKDEDPSSLTIDLLKKGTIQGYVFADLDLTTEGLEPAPAGTELILTVDYSELGSTATGYWSDTASVGSDGTFTAEVPVTTEGANVEITPLPYSYAQVQAYGSYYPTVNKLYTDAGTTISVKEGELKVAQIGYSYEDFDGFVDMIELSGELVADLDQEEIGYENCASGISLTFYGEGFSKVVTTGTNGSFSVVLPKGYGVYVDCEFTAQKSVYDAIDGDYDDVSYTYTLENKSLGDFGGSTSDYELSAGNGEETE